MHVEISVALNFVISYLYNKLPRRRVTLFGEELEVELKKKFEGHWYPDKPNKGSGYRCIKANGDEIDPVLVNSATKAGLDLGEVRDYLPHDLTLWIDPSEVSYKISERGQVKVLYNDPKDDDITIDTFDQEIQAANNQSFNPEAQTFTPESQIFSNDIVSFGNNQDMSLFCSDPSQSFQPIDSLSSSLSNLSLSPSSPVPPTAWSNQTSPSSTPYPQAATPAPYAGGRNNNASRQQMTAAMFAQTKFGSTKLKNNAKRPNRLSPTEFSNFFRQQQRPPTYAGPQRPRSLSPRDPRVEFLIDQQQRVMINQHHYNQQPHVSPTMPYGNHGYANQQQQQQQHMVNHHHQSISQHHQQHMQQLSPSNIYPDMYSMRQPSPGTPSPFSSPHISPQNHGTSFHELAQQGHPSPSLPSPSRTPVSRPTSLSHHGRPHNAPRHNMASPGGGFTSKWSEQSGLSGNNSGFPSPSGFSAGGSGFSSTMSSPGRMNPAQMATLSPDNQSSFGGDNLGVAPMGYSNNLQHLLMAN